MLKLKISVNLSQLLCSHFCGSEWQILGDLVGFALTVTTHYRRRQGGKANFQPLQHQADFLSQKLNCYKISFFVRIIKPLQIVQVMHSIFVTVVTGADLGGGCRGQGSRLTFQLASPVASDRFDSQAKTNFSLARYSNIHHRLKSSKC